MSTTTVMATTTEEGREREEICGGINPFMSKDRENFPEWSPLFSKNHKTTPSSSIKKPFQWSIDQMAKLKPVDIATSPASLAITNAASPHDNPNAQLLSDQFFAQKTIFPSPWTDTNNKLKRVTFSPLPPTTSYYNSEESIKKIDASTQTVLSIPMSVDLEQLLGREYYMEEEHSTSLRRKLFGHPRKSSEDDSCHDNSNHHENESHEEEEQLETKSIDTQLSSTPLRSSSTSPAVYITKINGTSPHSPLPLYSSFLGNDNLPGSPPLLSPISVGHQLELSPICKDTSVIDEREVGGEANKDSLMMTSPVNSNNAQVKIVKRHFVSSPHSSPAQKQPCIDHTHSPQDHTHSIPPPLSLNELQEESHDSLLSPSTNIPTTCTTYFNHLVLEETLEKPVLTTSSWQPNTHSTMLEAVKVAPPILTSSIGGVTHIDSGVGVSTDGSCPVKTTPILGVSRLSPVKYPGLSLLPSRLKVATPTSRYTSDKSPFTSELVRKKNYFKSKLNFSSPVKTIPLRSSSFNNLSLSPSSCSS